MTKTLKLNSINPYTNNLLWSLLYFKDLKKQGHTTILWGSTAKKRKLQPIIDNLQRRMDKKYGKK